MGEPRVAVVGGGSWGTALAAHLGGLGRTVSLWIRESDLVERMAQRRDNPLYLPGIRIPDPVTPHGRLDSAVEGAGLVVAAVPTPFARVVYTEMAPALPPDVPVVVAAKGIEERTLALPLEVARAVLGERRPYAVLSGPSFAVEFARGVPTAAVIASGDKGLAAWMQERLSAGRLRLYTNRDEIGVQLAGALKNVIAIAAGIVDGLGLGHNSLAALVTRGLAEMTRLGSALGGRPSTFSGLAGLGDLVATCTGAPSRNRRVGQALARGERLDDVLGRTRFVAEGVRTTHSAREMAHRAGVDMPIVDEVYRILYEDDSPRDALDRLMGRPLTAEAD